MRNGARQVLRQVEEQVAALGDIEQLHADADAEHWEASVGDEPHEHAVERFTARFHRADAGVEHIPVLPRVEVGAADKEAAMEAVEDRSEIFFQFERGDDDGDSAGGEDRIVVAGGNVRESGGVLLGASEFGVQTNQRLRSHSGNSLLQKWKAGPETDDNR